MDTGTVKWFNAPKGYGFIEPTSDGLDVFVHISAVQQSGPADRCEGWGVSYETETGRNGKISAVGLTVMNA